ncbi:hypothetical protein KEJ24_00040 [Candidatus Bathyarchaeota archaeon]|nr:hypothetical protein [Candidatus Bathyarchaeota archaeon]
MSGGCVGDPIYTYKKRHLIAGLSTSPIRNVHGRGLRLSQQFLRWSRGALKDFLDAVNRDRLLPRVKGDV